MVMKILSTEQIRLADLYTIEHEPIASIDLMERAAGVCCEWLEKKFRPEINFVYSVVRVITRRWAGHRKNADTIRLHCESIQSRYRKSLDDFALNHKRLFTIDKNSVTSITNKLVSFIAGNSVVLDALFGSGLNRPVSGLAAELIDHINSSEAGVVSIDNSIRIVCR